ncbi:MAG: SH3 domain-containing protein, partial [Actinomycetota bacterium]|nr:SH3 domain-containing protein [Actinomycetota bacterium]
LHRVTSGEPDTVYVLEPIEVRDLGATDAVAGYLQPGQWYLVRGEAGAWARVEDPNGPLEGWAPVAALYRRVEVPDDEPAIEPAVEQREVVWLATHVVPAAGIRSWAIPDGSTQPVADLSADVELQVTELRSDWAHVRAENGWEAWVDARQLLSVDGDAPGSPEPPVSAATGTPTLETTVQAPPWNADHAVPAEGLRAWAEPDPAGDVVANLSGGVELQVIERRADWANVRAENGWEAWVDGRRLIPILASGTASPSTPVPVSGDSTLNNVGARALAVARSHPVRLIAAIALLASVFLPWFGGGAPWSFDLPAGFLWSFSADTGWLSVGLVMLIVGAVALASVFVDQIAPFRRIVGGVAAAIAALWLIQTFRALLDFTDSAFAGIVADMFTDYFALGPWVALAAGVALLVRR